MLKNEVAGGSLDVTSWYINSVGRVNRRSDTRARVPTFQPFPRQWLSVVEIEKGWIDGICDGLVVHVMVWLKGISHEQSFRWT